MIKIKQHKKSTLMLEHQRAEKSIKKIIYTVIITKNEEETKCYQNMI